MQDTLPLFVSCPKGLEFPLIEELRSLGAGDPAETRAGVSLQANMDLAMRICLWSRFANRVLMPLTSGMVNSTDELYELAGTIHWHDYLLADRTFAVHTAARHPEVRNSHFAALRVKDAIRDQLQDKTPDIEPKSPDIGVYAYVDQEGTTIGLDLSTRSLHERGYRRKTGPAPLKENLAAALLWRAGWPDHSALLDPFCGSGTLLIEGAMMAADCAPGLMNPHFGFQSLPGFDAGSWNTLLTEAETRAQDGRQALQKPIRGYDADAGAIRAAHLNIDAAGFNRTIHVETKSVRELDRIARWPDDGLILGNLPYGERLEMGERSLSESYRVLGEQAAELYAGHKLGVLTAHDELAREITLPLDNRYRFYNGALPCRLFVFDVVKPVEQEGTTMVANRITKNLRKLKNYLKQADTEAYRVYEADIPEYSVAVDRYGDRIHVQEFAAPHSIPEVTAHRRLTDAIRGVQQALDVPPGAIYLKQRSRQRGESQYGRQGEEHDDFWVTENDLDYKVNLSDYLDSGLFLDHRITRKMLQERAADKNCLNLFSYTASVSVAMAAGGATRVTSVDLSRTYQEWAADNLQRNGFNPARHLLIKADVLAWLNETREKFDLIFLDPPTFSNSKSMFATLDIQRDHARLIDRCMDRLAEGGELWFSTNARKFSLDESVESDYHVEEKTHETVPPDFARRPPHRSFVIQRN